MITKIEAIVCAGEKFTPEQIHVITRKKEIIQVRQIISYFAYKEAKMTFEKIGEYFGQDHSNAVHSVKTVGNYIDTDSIYRDKIRVYQDEINKYKKVIEKIDVLNLLIAPLEKEIKEYENRINAIHVLIEDAKKVLKILNT